MSGWSTRLLGELAESIDYGVTASAAQSPVGPRFLRITDIQDGAVNWRSVPWCECDARASSESRLKSGDIVFARTGATTGKSFLIRDCPEDAVFASYLIRVRLNKIAAPRFISHFFQTPMYWAQVAKKSRGVAQPGINATTLKEIEIPVPSLSEQHRVAEVLDRADALRVERRAALALLDTLTQSIFLEMFGDPATNPKTYPTKPLSALVRAGDTINYGVVQPGDDRNDGIPLVRVGDLHMGHVRHSSLKRISPSVEAAYKRSRLRGDEILVSCVGSIGLVATADETVRGFNIARAVARIPLAPSIERSFVVAYLSSDWAQRYFVSELRIVSQPTLNIKQLSETRVFIPPIELQNAFASRISAFNRLKALHFNSLGEFDALFASLQHRAFRGQL